MNNTSNIREDNMRPSINRETYRTIKKMSLVEFRSFLFRYTSHLGSSSGSFDTDKLMQELGTIKGVGEKTVEEVASAVKNRLGCMDSSVSNNPFRTVDRDTYQKVRKMSREELEDFLVNYAESSGKGCTVDLRELEQDIRKIKGIGEKRAEEIMSIIEKNLGV